MQEEPQRKTSFPLSAAQVKEVEEISQRIESLGKILILGFPRTSPGAIAMVHEADRTIRPERYCYFRS